MEMDIRDGEISPTEWAGEVEFGPSASVDPDQLTSRWFDHWLKGVDNGIDREAPVHIFIMGGGDGHKTGDGRLFAGGCWRDEPEWPLKRATQTSYYLHSNGVLSTRFVEKMSICIGSMTVV